MAYFSLNSLINSTIRFSLSITVGVSEVNPSTNLTVYIKRANIVNDKEHSIIPDPMFDPLNETNIEKQTAISFEVKEGDYIQIICPTGRQCSDFVAFDTNKLNKGIEKGLDWQTTRTFMGNTFPGPGLYSKFYERLNRII